MEQLGGQLKGIYRDILKDGRGHILSDSGWSSNTIVHRCRILLAGFIKGDASGGIHHLSFGMGRDSWDHDGPPPPDPSATDLIAPYPRPMPLDTLGLTYLDDDNNEVSTPTSRLQITAILEPGYPDPTTPAATYPLREFGLFGTFDGAYFMINSIRHPVIHKDASATLIRKIRLHF
ncbi:hypothetical protein [Desulfoluna spongiiphila]|uniref:Uncharacterized protein n=1 Tax=Desulfoluna spongiiphila TaxID=419481 RepID=A0A1G5J2I8_9BACT|nr:hypothetical protein [Desulfoluna spongiiphila]SCY82404.1 hypothetical protein SAMN05216233_12428 [Desulfoluna spongiiphila]